MFHFNDRIAVAVSGGKDSISLLHVLAKMERFHPKASLVAVTVDEGIKGYRDEALGGRELTACAYCGVLRRRALNVAARAVDASKIATAHTLDDEVQTILLNIFHGDMPRLAKEKPVTDEVHSRFVQKVKPFCEIPEKESALYAYVKKVKFQGTPCPYASEALRNDIRVMLNRMEEKHAGTKFTIFNSVERIRPALDEIAKKDDFEECVECGEPASRGLCKVCQMLKQVG
jgi:uncharacterized protein (TIGR00269 family)